MIRMQDILKKSIDNGDTVKNIAKSTGISKALIYRLLNGTKQRYSTYASEQISKFFDVEMKDVEEFQDICKRGRPKKVDVKPVNTIKDKPEIVKKNCINTDCLLNKECKCMSDHVNLGLAGCVSYNKEPNNLPKDLSSSNRKRLFLNQEA